MPEKGKVREKRCAVEAKYDTMISVKKSRAVKGIAILLMIVHHTFGLPGQWFEEGYGYGQTLIGGRPLYEWVANPTKLCVGLFAFLTGWAYCVHGTQTLRYGIHKTWKLFLQYWWLLFFLFVPLSFLISGYRMNRWEFFYNVFCLNDRMICFSWYVLFYGLCICTLPLLSRLTTGRVQWDLLLLTAVFALLYRVVEQQQFSRWYLQEVIKDYLYWMPVVWVGFWAARYRMFSFCRERFGMWKKGWYVLLFAGMMVLRGVCCELFGLNLDVIYAPVAVFCLVSLLPEQGLTQRLIDWLGSYSLYIWLIHSLFFFSGTRSFFQPLVYGCRLPFLTPVLILVNSTLFAWIYKRIWNDLETGFQRLIKRGGK